MNYIIVLPTIYQPYTHAFLKTISAELLPHILIINNTTNNIGVTRSWNQGIDNIHKFDKDWLILCSAAIRFGPPGGRDYINTLNPYFDVIEATNKTSTVYGWHLIAFHRRVFDTIGRFDENFLNYYADIDYSLRYQKAFGELPGPGWNKTVIKVKDMGMAHGLKLGGAVDNTNDQAINYFTQKWGRHPSSNQPTYNTPFNDPSNSLEYWPCPTPSPQ